MASLQWRSCNVFIAIIFVSPVRLCLQTLLPSFLTVGYTKKYRSSSRNSKPMKMHHELYEHFHNGYRTINFWAALEKPDGKWVMLSPCKWNRQIHAKIFKKHLRRNFHNWRRLTKSQFDWNSNSEPGGSRNLIIWDAHVHLSKISFCKKLFFKEIIWNVSLPHWIRTQIKRLCGAWIESFQKHSSNQSAFC